MKSQQRFIFALVASAAVLIGWNYFFPPVPPPPPNANANVNANQQVAQASPQSTAQAAAQASPSITPQPTATATPSSAQPAASPTPTPEAVPQRKIRVVTVDSEKPSPFAASLLFSYVASFLYDGDAPLAERRAQALVVDQAQLRELVGDAELRELLDVDAMDAIE